jgi:hypothetical protein
MRRHPPREWFAPYKIGWGIGPATWEGWLATLAFCALVVVVLEIALP